MKDSEGISGKSPENVIMDRHKIPGDVLGQNIELPTLYTGGNGGSWYDMRCANFVKGLHGS